MTTYYVFGQDMRKAGAQTNLSSVPKKWLKGMGKGKGKGKAQVRLGLEAPVPVILDDPEGRGDSAPNSGAANCGDIIAGAYSLYSTRLCDALGVFGLELNLTPAKVYGPGCKEPLEGYSMVRGVPDVECVADGHDKLEFFRIDPAKTGGLSLFDARLGGEFSSRRIIDDKLKAHLDVLDLVGVFMLPTEEYGGRLASQLTMG